MNPIVIRKEEAPTSAIICKDCNGAARAVWLDNDGAVPLCDPCVEARQKAHRRKYAGMPG